MSTGAFSGRVETSELLPCPFCGAKFLFGQEPHDNYPVAGQFYLYHDYGPLGSAARKCPIEVRPHFETKEEAVAAWNTRFTCTPAQGEDVSTLIKRLREPQDDPEFPASRERKGGYHAALDDVEEELREIRSPAVVAPTQGVNIVDEDSTVAWIAFSGNGNVRFWTNDPKRAEDERSRGMDLRAFTLYELVALSTRQRTPAEKSLDLQSCTVSCTGLDITIQCSGHETKERLIDLLTGSGEVTK